MILQKKQQKYMKNRLERIKFFLTIAIIENLNRHLANIKKMKNRLTFCSNQ